jgi:hypothetical protein
MNPHGLELGIALLGFILTVCVCGAIAKLLLWLETKKQLDAACVTCGALQDDQVVKQAKPIEATCNLDGLAKLGWQAVECSICGSHAMAYPKPVQEPASDEMTWEDFAKIAYEAAAVHRKDRLISNGRTNEAEQLPIEFYELGHDGRDSWIHGCAVALAAYKKLTLQSRELIAPILKQAIAVAINQLYDTDMADVKRMFSINELLEVSAIAEAQRPKRVEDVYREAWDSLLVSSCHCAACKPNTLKNQRMILCAKCGNKRCPHATNHIFACTNSNDLDQVGNVSQETKPVQQPEWYHGIDDAGCNRFYHKDEVRPSSFGNPLYTSPQREHPPLVQIASDIMGACMNGDLSDKWEDVADLLVSNNFDGLSKLTQLQEPMSEDELLEAIARGWCHEKNEHKTMDSDLATAIASEVSSAIEAQH